MGRSQKELKRTLGSGPGAPAVAALLVTGMIGKDRTLGLETLGIKRGYASLIT